MPRAIALLVCSAKATRAVICVLLGYCHANSKDSRSLCESAEVSLMRIGRIEEAK